ncbi:hypothetical protein FZEAL_630 [Fusarium zealandicum]|uniref:DUF7702 domain-containing protein n=1 Tax=Fusarium zealandicum TaxID=1053134 RepID=A0A8H4UUZ9_9HYPO|nr:hypothetical protein FZEAL_630 [Fusarium zealandicum]
MTDSISAAKLAIYIIFAQPALYCLFKHGKPGFVGWFYVQLFCVLRIATGGMGLHGSKTSAVSLVLNSVGLSPLLLAASGVLHEARRATDHRLNRKLDIILEVQYHVLMAAAMAIMVTAVIKLQQGDSTPTMKILLRVGSALIALAWLLLVLWALWSLAKVRGSQRGRRIHSMPGGNLRILHYTVQRTASSPRHCLPPTPNLEPNIRLPYFSSGRGMPQCGAGDVGHRHIAVCWHQNPLIEA